MSFFKPNYFIDSLSNLSPELLLSNNIKLVILDIDDTLTKRGDQNIDQKTLNWIKDIQKSGIELFLISNNFYKRVKPFAEKVGLPFVCLSCKPLPIGFIYAMIKTKTKRKNTIIIGDQIFTDILGANLIGVASALVEPKSESTRLFMKIKRAMEFYIKSNLQKTNFNYCGDNYEKEKYFNNFGS